MRQDLIVPPTREIGRPEAPPQCGERMPDDLQRMLLQRAHEAALDRQARDWWRVLGIVGGLAVVCVILVAWFAGAAMEQSQAVALHALDTAAAIAESAAKVAPERQIVTADSGTPWLPLEAVVFVGILIVAGILAAKGGL